MILSPLELFNSEAKKQNAVNTLRNGMKSDFWQLITQVIDFNIDQLKEIVIAKSQDGKPLTDEELDEARYKIQIFRDVAKTPEKFINLFTGIDLDEEPLDPYEGIKVPTEGEKPKDFDIDPYEK